MLTNLEKVVERWRCDQLALLPPLTGDEILGAFRHLEQPLSQDVFRLYRTVGGMEDYTSDGATCWVLWSLERIVKQNCGHRQPYLWFADFLIDSHFYCLKYETSETSSVHLDYLDGTPPLFLCSSLDSFFEKYLNLSEDALLKWLVYGEA